VCWNPRIHQVELFLVEREAQARGLVHVGGDDGRLSGFRVDLPSALRLTTLTPRLTLPNWLDMSSDPTHAVARQDLAFEMAHVLFLDIVAYSRLPMEQQAGVLHRLQELVRQTPEFPRAQKTHRLITLPTGDGMALVFFNDPEAPARCAVELAQAIRAEPGLELRMGIHTGPVYRVADINANRNVAGGGINLAQRVMDCGDGGHILVSQSVADVLGHLDVWKNTLHDLGEAEVKHGVRIHLYNLYTDQAGNSVLPRKLRDAQEATRLARSRVRRRRMWLALAVGGTLMLAVAAAFLMRPHPLTEKDTLVLADFSNNTGDPVFNDALKQGLAVELEQSPFLNILSEDRVSQQLRYMGHSVDDHVTPEIAQEVCRREGSKAMLLGSIASLGSHYVIGLKAVNCRNGDSLGKEQVEAERREDVLAKLHEAGTRLRNKLGESLTSIQKYDTPLEQATTSSLEALQAYSMAMKIWRSKQTVLYSFCSEGADHCTDGQIPRAGLVQDTGGNLYGTTEGGGSGTGDNGYGGGTVFKLDSTGHETVLYSFCSEGGAKCTDGNYPYAGLIQDAAGNLYGTTWEGGANSEYGGTLFKVDNTGHETTLYSFCAEGGSKCTDGAQPSGGLIRDAAGNLYGTTNFGGTNGLGAVFKLDGTGHETVLYSFCPGGNPCKDGSVPSAALIQDAAGNLYGTTEYGGTNGPDGGTVFKLDSTGHETVLYSFCSEGGSKCTDGEGPLAGLIQDAAGDLYGTTWEGGAKGDGTVFKLAREKACVDASRSLCK